MKTLIHMLKIVVPKSLFYHLVMITVCLFGIGCEKVEFQEFDNELGQIHVSDTRIILTPKHITGIKSERYQPSLNLYGFLMPMQQTFITSPQRIKLFEILVSNNQIVKKNEPLVKYLVAPSLQKNNVPITSVQVVSKETSPDNQPLQKISERFEDVNVETINIVSNLSSQPILSINAPFKGVLQQVYYNQERVFHGFMPTIVEKEQPILILRSENNWQFISILPKYTKPQLSIGQHVNFAVLLPQGIQSTEGISITYQPRPITLTGQISSITPITNGGNISVNVHVVPEKNRQFQLKQGMKVQGNVSYGQMAVGTLIDKAGVHEIRDEQSYGSLGTDLSVFTKANADIVAPIKAFVWIVGQDRKLKRQVVDVIRYHQQTGQYLVAGIPNDVLICLVSLPKSVEGKIVKLS